MIAIDNLAGIHRPGISHPYPDIDPCTRRTFQGKFLSHVSGRFPHTEKLANQVEQISTHNAGTPRAQQRRIHPIMHHRTPSWEPLVVALQLEPTSQYHHIRHMFQDKAQMLAQGGDKARIAFLDAVIATNNPLPYHLPPRQQKYRRNHQHISHRFPRK
jgi:hypothetical protein